MLKLGSSCLAGLLLMPLLAGMLGWLDGETLGESLGVSNAIWMVLAEMTALVLLCGLTTAALRAAGKDAK